MLIQVILLACTYYITGKLGLLLALSPGYASLVWPPVGLSIAGLLLFGLNRWPGVLLGAFFVNLKNLNSLTDWATACGVSIGNTLGILIAVYFIKKLLAFPKSFYSEKDILIFLAIAGPTGAIVSSTIGIGTLYSFQLLNQSNLALNWLYWFIGDSTGGIIFAPLALIFSIQSRPYWLKSASKVLLPLFIFFGLIVASLQYVLSVEKEKFIADFTYKSQIAFGILDRNVVGYAARLEILRGYFETSETVTENEFNLFAETLLSQRDEIKVYAWMPAFASSHLIKYIAPESLQTKPIENFLNSNPQIRELTEKSIKQQTSLFSDKINLEPLGLEDSGILLITYSKKHSGVLIQIVSLSEALTKYLQDFTNRPGYHVFVEIMSNESPKNVKVPVDRKGLPFQQRADLTWSSNLVVGDHLWRVTFSQDPAIGDGTPYSTAPLLVGLLVFTFLTCALVIVIFTRVVSIEEMVREKTRDLQDLNGKLQKASATKSDFLANMSHEIRTPLNVLIGMADLLDDSNLTAEQRHYIDISRKAGDNLLNIINDILDISKIEAGLITLEKTKVNIAELVHDTAEMFSVNCREKRLSFKIEISPELHDTYLGDPTRIRQILANLISNAIKFTMQGGVKIRVTPNKDSARPGNILFEIIDTGIGIPADKIPNLFQPFTQADSTITRKFGGTGLGLSISKRLTEMMNGKISVQSDVHRGSTFSFTLNLPVFTKTQEIPVAATSANGETTPLATNDKKLKILIVDDTDDNRTLIKEFLKKTPHIIFEANNGEKAIQFVKDNHPDLVLMDMQMPVMDGFTATRKIRQWENDTHQTPIQIWALTAYALTTEINKSMEAGCNLHLIKPIRRQELVARIRELTGANLPPH